MKTYRIYAVLQASARFLCVKRPVVNSGVWGGAPRFDPDIHYASRAKIDLYYML